MLQLCPECNKAISTSALRCPACGWSRPRQLIRAIAIPALALSSIAAVAVFVYLNAAWLFESEADAAARKAEEADISFAAESISALAKRMRNPPSLVLDSARWWASGQTVCARFRAHNGFGAMTPGAAIITGVEREVLIGTEDELSPAWDLTCAGQSTKDITAALKAKLAASAAGK